MVGTLASDWVYKVVRVFHCEMLVVLCSCVLYAAQRSKIIVVPGAICWPIIGRSLAGVGGSEQFFSEPNTMHFVK